MTDVWDGADSAGVPSVPAVLQNHADTCAECASRLQAALMLVAPPGLHVAAPEGLSRKVLARVGKEEGARSAASRDGTGRTAPRLHRWVAVAAAAMLLVAASVSLTLAVTGRGHSPVMVELMFDAPGARRVAVVGDWNGWDPGAHTLVDADGDGVWTIELSVEPGREYQYQFIVDGERWVPDPNAPIQVDDGFGGTNSVLNI